jgi:hypothetical protein
MSRLLPILACAALAACRPPGDADGYPEGVSDPWMRARPLLLSDDDYTKIDVRLSVAEARRAAWYSFDLPHTANRLSVRAAQRERPRRRLGLELFDANGHRLQSREAGHLKLSAEPLPAGRYYIHVYVRERGLARVRLTFDSGQARRPPLPEGCLYPDAKEPPGIASDVIYPDQVPCMAQPPQLPPQEAQPSEGPPPPEDWPVPSRPF